MTLGTNEAGSLSLADRLEIQDLMGRQHWASDARNGEAAALTCTEDCIFDGFEERLRFRGRAALLERHHQTRYPRSLFN